MDFIKKHYEKMVLALALVGLIVSAVILSMKVNELSQENAQAVRRPKPKGNSVPSIPLGGYTNAIEALKHPPLWTEDPSRLFVGADVDRPTPQPGDNTTVECNPVCLVRVTREPFSLLFKAYTGEGHNFQLNFISWARTFYVSDVGQEIADRYGKTAYFIKQFTQKKVAGSSSMGNVEKDVSELTLLREGEDPIVLVFNEVKEGREQVAWVRCKGETLVRPVRRQQSFVCEGMSYKVVDIAPKQMIIMDEKSEGRQTIPLSGPK